MNMHALSQTQEFPIPRLPFAESVSTLPARLRRAKLEDLTVLSALIQLSVRALNAADYSQRQIESALKYEYGADNRQLILEGTYYVVELDGQVVGSGGWSRRKNLTPTEDSGATGELCDPKRDPAKIRAFFVHPGYARRGIATRILKACEQSARQAGFRMLELIATRTGEPVYARFGFEVIERIDFTLPDGMIFPAARMVKTI